MHQENIFSLKGKSILITGASSGIGSVVAKMAAGYGATLIITGRNKQRLQETYNNLAGSGHRFICADLTKKEDLDVLALSVDQLDGIVFGAGVIDYMIAKNIDTQAMEEVLDVNYKSQISLYQQLHLNKKIKKGASMVFISSVSALAAVPATLAYAASKAAINSSVRILASELAKLAIRVNSISPGLIESPMLEKSVIGNEYMEDNKSKYPLGPGKPEDVAYAAVFLLSDASRWITGINMIVDGGYMLKN